MMHDLNSRPAHDWYVLIVEDEYDSIQMVSKVLEHHGARVHVVNDGHEALAVLEEFEPTCIIMDLALPELDGWKTLIRIRENPSLKDIPVAAITAYHSVNVEDDVIRAGFDAYMPKPININTMIYTLQKMLNIA